MAHIGLACCLLLLYVNYEWSYDKCYKNLENIYITQYKKQQLFLIALILSVFIVTLTVSFQTVKVAKAKAVDAKYE